MLYGLGETFFSVQAYRSPETMRYMDNKGLNASLQMHLEESDQEALRMNERKNYNFKMKYCEIFSELLKMYIVSKYS